MKKVLLTVFLLLPLVAQAEPRQTIVSFQAELLEYARSDVDVFEQRFAALQPVVESTHDLDYISRLTLGRHWARLNKQQRDDFTARFRSLAIASYAARFPDFAGKRFEIVAEEMQPRGIAMVRTQLHRPDGDPLDFDYLLHETADGWRIVNILVDGVSDLALKRAEYSAVLRDGSADDLVRTLDEQLLRLQAD